MNNNEKKIEILKLIKENRISSAEGYQRLLKLKEQTSFPDLQPVMDEDIAVIGMAGQFPKAVTVDEFWKLLREDKNLMQEVPKERWDIDQFYDSIPGKENKTYCRKGGFLSDIDLFDARFFHVSDKEAQWMDPQQRLFLTECWNALEDAGYARLSSGEQKCGVFVGVGQSDYQDRFKEGSISVGPQAFWGNDTAVLASRISYFLNLKGISISVNTACSSSLIAIHLACMSIRNKECEMALAGGVYVGTTPAFYLASSGARMLSMTNECNAFDYRASGFVPGEACCALVLKSKARAIEDGDQIYCVIKASKAGQDGKTNGITAPSAKAQTMLEESLYQEVDLNPETICYVETHGTGTPLGDPIEFTALKNSFEKMTRKKNFCALGSVKVNMGHAATAAGAVSVIKAACMLHEQVLLPYRSFEKENPQIDFQNSPFYINRELRKMDSEDIKNNRIAVSAFGFSGTNCHMVLEGYQREQRTAKRGLQMFFFSSGSREGLRKTVEKTCRMMERYSDADLQNIAYTLNVRRQWFSERCFFIADGIEEFKSRMKDWLIGENFRGETAISGGETPVKLIEALKVAESEEKKREILSKIGNSFLNGKEFDLGSIYHGCTCVSLPTYSFQKMHYWIEEKKQNHPAAKCQMMFYQRCLEKAVIPEGERLSVAVRNLPEEILYISDQYRAVNRRSDHIYADFRSGISITEAIEKYCSVNNKRGRLVIELNAGTPDDEPEKTGDTFGNVLSIFRQLIAHSVTELIALIVIHCRNTTGKAAFYALQAAASCVDAENPGYHTEVVCLEDEIRDVGELLALESKEVTCGIQPGPVIYRDGERYRSVLKRLQPKAESGCKLKKHGTYMITGGMKGIGYLLAGYLASNYGAKLVLVGRKNEDAGILERQDDLRYRGAQSVIYFSADISDEKMCKEFADKMKADSIRFDGIFHCAGVIEDNRIPKKDEESWRRVIAPKMKGSLLIENYLLPLTEDFVLFFSSVVALFGSIGQIDYAYANSFMDYFAEEKYRTDKPRLISLNMFLWKNGGMNANAGHLDKIRREIGLEAMAENVGFQMIEDAIAAGKCNVAAMFGDEGRITSFIDSFGNRKKKPEQAVRREEISEKNQVKEIENFLIRLFSKETSIPAEEITPSHTFEQLGLDSIMVMNMNSILDEKFKDVPKSIFYDATDIHELAQELCRYYDGEPLGKEIPQEDEGRKAVVKDEISEAGAEDEPEKNDDTGKHMYRDVPAIVGISAIFPGADNVDEFWKNLAAGRDCVSEIPASRWDYKTIFDRLPGKLRESYCRFGGFINNFDCFDPLFFNISPKEAEWMDPQERLLIEVVWHAIEDAGYTRQSLRDKRVGVFVGVTNAHYQLYETEVYGNSVSSLVTYASLSNRISYLFGFHGPSMSVDTMCSSFLTAMKLGMDSLAEDECDICIVGSSNLLLHEHKYLQLAISKFASVTGKCHSFGEDADGYVPGEGVCAVILKKLSDAQRARDNIYATIQGIGINHGGKTNGYTVPSPKAQSEVILKALENAGVSPEEISYVEAHGAGTPLGDPIEIDGLTKAYRNYTDRNGYVAIGSVKSNIGHLEAAAGAAGLIKVLLQMKNKMLVGSLHADVTNHNIDFTRTPFYVQKANAVWEPVNRKNERIPRLAAVSAFGAGGANAHMIVKEYERSLEQSRDSHCYLIPFSAMDLPSLRETCRDMLNYLMSAVSDSKSEPAGNFEYAELVEIVSETFQIPGEFLQRECILGDCGTDLYHFHVLREKLRKRGMIFPVEEAEFELLNMEELYRRVVPAKKERAAHTELSLRDAAYTLQIGREPMKVRIAFAVSDWKELCESLAEWINSGKAGKCYQVKAQTVCCGDREAGRDERGPLSIEEYDLLSDWLTKKEVDWTKLEANKGAYRISLPGYSFRKEHYLIDRHAVKHRKNPGDLVLGNNVSMLNHCRYQLNYDGTEFFLKDHVLMGKKILPGMAYLEIARANAQAATGKVVTEIQHIVWSSPFIMDKDLKTMIVDLEDGKDHINCVFSGETIYAKCKLLTGEDYPAADKINISAIIQRCCNTVSPEQLYSVYQAGGLNYGESFRMMEQVWFNEKEAVSILSVPETAEYYRDNAFVLHPSMLDAALQAGICIQNVGETDAETKTRIPYYLEKLKIYGRMQRRCYCHLTLAEEDSNGARKINCDIYAEDGSLLVAILAFTAREAKEDKHIFTYRSKLDEVELKCEAPKGDYVLISDDSGISEWMEMKYNGCKCYGFEQGISEPDILGASKLIVDSRAYGFFNESRYEECMEKTILQTFKVLQKINQKEPEHDRKLVILVDEAQDIISAVSASVAGLFYSVKTGLKRTESVLVSVKCGRTKECLDDVIAIMENDQGAYHYRLGVNGTEVYSEEACTIREVQKHRIETGGTYCIIGGRGGIGRILAEYLVKQYRTNLILIGRGESTEEDEKFFDFLRKQNSVVKYYRGDVTDHRRMQEIWRELASMRLTPKGVFHAAGMNSRGKWEEKTAVEIKETLLPKISGTIVMAEITKEYPMDFVLLFGSTASIVGDFGRGDYGMANSFLDQMSAGRATDTEKTEFYTIRWPIWRNGGMHIGTREAEEKLLKKTGMDYMDNASAMMLMEKVLAGNQHLLTVMCGDKKRIDRTMAAVGMRQKANGKNIAVEAGTKERVRKHDEGVEYVSEIKQIIGSIMNISIERIDEEESLEAYGFNSVSIAELCEKLNSSFSIDMNPTIFFEYDTIRKLAEYLGHIIRKEAVIQQEESEADNRKQADKQLHSYLLRRSKFRNYQDLYDYLELCSNEYKARKSPDCEGNTYDRPITDVDTEEELFHMLVEIGGGQKVEVMACGKGDILVVLPGFGISGAALIKQIEELSSKYRIVLIHLPGSGFSDGMKDILYPPRIAGVIMETLDRLGIRQKVAIMSFSLGGIVAQELVCRFPERFRLMILGCSFTRADSAETKEESLEEKFVRDFKNTGNEEEFYHFYELSKCVNRSSINYLAEASLKKYEEVKGLEKVTIPTLVISADRDAVVNSRESEIIAERIANSIHVEFEGHGHCVNLTNSGSFNRLAEKFIETEGALGNEQIRALGLSSYHVRKNYMEKNANR